MIATELPVAPARAFKPPAAAGLSRRHYLEHVVDGPNAHARWYRARKHRDGPVLGPLRIVCNYLVI